ncbi:MAG: hypothetical protein QXK24_01880 [Ignisphaera sp.]
MEITIQTIVSSCLYFSIAFLIDDYAKRILAQSMALFKSMI